MGLAKSRFNPDPIWPPMSTEESRPWSISSAHFIPILLDLNRVDVIGVLGPTDRPRDSLDLDMLI